MDRGPPLTSNSRRPTGRHSCKLVRPARGRKRFLDSTRRFFRVLSWRLKAGVMLAAVVASSQLVQAPLVSAATAGIPAAVHQSGGPACTAEGGSGSASLQACNSASAVVDDTPRLTVPAGDRQCPASGPGASCNAYTAAALPAPGVSSLPIGASACAVRSDKVGPNAPASCNNILLAAPQATEPAGGFGTTSLPAPVTPSVPIWTLAAGSAQRLRLTSNVGELEPGQNAMLTATASSSMSGTRSAIEIFDLTTGTLVGACLQGSQCQVAYAAKSGAHTFAAYITPPSAKQPTENVVTSNAATVSWLGIGLATTSASIVGPGKPVTFIATATADVSVGGYRLGIYDQTSGTELTYCSRGTACSVTLTKSNAGTRSIVAYVATLPAASTNTSSGLSAALPPTAVLAQSAPIMATWLGVNLDADTTRPQLGGSVVMRATANVDVTNTPWSIGIYDQQGELVSASCKSGTTCTATVNLGPGATPFFTAVIGAARQPISNGSSSSALVQLVQTAQMHASLVNIQAQSKAVQPNRLLWGVDSCKTIAADATGGGGLYGQVTRWYGNPDFWARYLTDTYNCPGISSTEIAAAAYRNIGILPIFNNYDCSAVRTYKVGLLYGNEAVAAAENLGIATGSVLAIDIEPYGEQCPGAARVDAGFIEGWYDGITLAGYAPLYYGNGTAGSEFATSWCRAVAARPEVAVNSYLWSFEPSLYGRFTRAKAPSYSPEQPACAGNEAVWQYVLSSGARPDVDSDEALSSVPFWYPQGGG